MKHIAVRTILIAHLQNKKGNEMRINTFFISLLLLLVVGCSSAPKSKPESIITTKTELLLIPEELMQNCKVIMPFEKQEYLTSSENDKKRLLVKLNVEQYSSIESCNAQLSKLRSWQEEQKAIRK